MYVIILIIVFVSIVITAAIIIFCLEENTVRKLGHAYWLRKAGLEESSCIMGLKTNWTR